MAKKSKKQLKLEAEAEAEIQRANEKIAHDKHMLQLKAWTAISIIGFVAFVVYVSGAYDVYLKPISKVFAKEQVVEEPPKPLTLAEELGIDKPDLLELNTARIPLDDTWKDKPEYGYYNHRRR